MTLFSTYIGATTYDDGLHRALWGRPLPHRITEGQCKGPVQSMEIFQVRWEHPEYLTVGHFMRHCDEVDRALTHPRVMLGSDGILQTAGISGRRVLPPVLAAVCGRKSCSLCRRPSRMHLPARRAGPL